MANFALLIVAISVNVIHLVAEIAVERCLLIALVGVTAVACNLFMFILQRKFGLVMIVAGLFPALFLMAISTLLPEATTMGFPLLVALLTL
jgi:hypothetical protein